MFIYLFLQFLYFVHLVNVIERATFYSSIDLELRDQLSDQYW